MASKNSNAAKAELKAAKENLAKVGRAERDETQRFRDANRAVLKAEQNVSWWRR